MRWWSNWQAELVLANPFLLSYLKVSACTAKVFARLLHKDFGISLAQGKLKRASNKTSRKKVFKKLFLNYINRE